MNKVCNQCILILIFIFHPNCALNITEIIPHGYNPKQSPNPNGLTNVNISIDVNDLVAVSESTSSFQLDLTLKLTWIDPRLTLSTQISDQIHSPNNTIENIILGNSYITNFWVPDIFFQNGLSVSVVNSGLSIQYLVISLNKSITYTARMSGTFFCKMDLTDYPQDFQYCSVEAVSLTKTSSQMSLNWGEFVSGTTNYPKFIIKSTSMNTCNRTSYMGDFSCKRATLKLVRRVSYYMIRVYAPTFLSVIVTFVGFWIPVLAWPARVTILVTPLLSLITQDISLNNDINVSYVVAIHWWMIWCQVFIFLALIEYAAAISWSHFTNDKKALRATQQNNNVYDINKLKGHYFGNKGWFDRTGRVVDKILQFFFGNIDFTKEPLNRNKVDYCSRIVFPFLWIIWCLIYIFATICPWAANYDE